MFLELSNVRGENIGVAFIVRDANGQGGDYVQGRDANKIETSLNNDSLSASAIMLALISRASFSHNSA